MRAAKALRGEELDEQAAARLSVRRHRRLQGDRRRVLHAERAARIPKLDAYVDGLIAKIAAAQEPDGYLYTTRTINPENPHRWAGTERWVLERDDSHELYNLGHLFEAAVAHYLATGKKNLLDVATQAADLLVKTFGPGKRTIWPGHQITEMALVRLYRVTGNEQYLTPREVPARRARPGPLPPARRPIRAGSTTTRRSRRSSSRPSRSATRSARCTCIPAWPTSRR